MKLHLEPEVVISARLLVRMVVVRLECVELGLMTGDDVISLWCCTRSGEFVSSPCPFHPREGVSKT